MRFLEEIQLAHQIPFDDIWDLAVLYRMKLT